MTCPKCGCENTTIRESRQLPELRRRRYVCLNCNYKFTTHEIPVHRVYKNKSPRVYVSNDGMWVSSNLAGDIRDSDQDQGQD